MLAPDPAAQTVTTQQVALGPGGTCLYPVHIRYAWPTELDLMARIAGLRMRERWSDWHRQPFTSVSSSHVSVWEKPW